jgi:hypothetical protein
MTALASVSNNFVNSLRRLRGGPFRSRAAAMASRYGPGSVRVFHLVCRSPQGDYFDVVAVRGFVVVPEAMRRQPGLWWLESENHPHLVMEDSRVLEDAIGRARLGCWPYCIAAERWNEAAAQHRWLPRSPVSDREPPDPIEQVITDSRIEALNLPRRRSERIVLEPERTPTYAVAVRLHHGSAAVAYLFGRVARVPAALLATVSFAACAYYLAAVALWLWGLGDGISGPEIQDGAVLILAGLIASWLTGLFAPKLMPNDGVRFRVRGVQGRDPPPLVQVPVAAYRAGVVLQLIAFAGFVVM